MSKILKTIYFVRHGQSEANVSPLPVFQGPESPLNSIGKKQAESIAERFKNLSFEKIISSSFIRAKETAMIIANKTKHDIEYSDLFVERIKPSRINGKLRSDEELNILGGEWENSLYNHNIRVEDGENFDDLILRAQKALDFLSSQKEDRLVVVTHGFFLRTILMRVILSDFLTPDMFLHIQKHMATENTGISVLHLKEDKNGKIKWQLWIYNDHAHLD